MLHRFLDLRSRRKCEVDERNLLHEMLDFVSTEVEELGNQREITHIERIMREGTGADRQLAVWEQTHDLKAVVDHIVTALGAAGKAFAMRRGGRAR